VKSQHFRPKVPLLSFGAPEKIDKSQSGEQVMARSIYRLVPGKEAQWKRSEKATVRGVAGRRQKCGSWRTCACAARVQCSSEEMRRTHTHTHTHAYAQAHRHTYVDTQRETRG
jgi:hypothetical protein